MNYPFLIEPYNAWQKHPKRKKHWMEIAEEEALFVRMMQEARIQETKEQQSSQQVQDGNPANAAAAAGAGGVLFPYIYAEKSEVANFSISQDTVGGPLTLSFTNLTTTPEDDTFLWDLGGGSSSVLITPPPTFYHIGSYTIVLQSTSSAGNMTTKSLTFSASSPIILPSFTSNVQTGVSDLSVSFTNTTTADSNFALSYLWTFDTASTPTTSTATNPTVVFATGSHTIRMSATGAFYDIAASTSSINYISASLPTVTVAWTETGTTGYAPITTSFSNNTTMSNGTIPTTWRWEFGDGTTSTSVNPTHGYDTGSFTVKLQATGAYNVAGITTHTNVISASIPSVTASFTVDTSSGAGPLNVTFSNDSAVNGGGTLSYYWDFGSGSFTSIEADPTMSYDVATGVYTCSLYVTESRYQIWTGSIVKITVT